MNKLKDLMFNLRTVINNSVFYLGLLLNEQITVAPAAGVKNVQLCEIMAMLIYSTLVTILLYVYMYIYLYIYIIQHHVVYFTHNKIHFRKKTLENEKDIRSLWAEVAASLIALCWIEREIGI